MRFDKNALASILLLSVTNSYAFVPNTGHARPSMLTQRWVQTFDVNSLTTGQDDYDDENNNKKKIDLDMEYRQMVTSKYADIYKELMEDKQEEEEPPQLEKPKMSANDFAHQNGYIGELETMLNYMESDNYNDDEELADTNVLEEQLMQHEQELMEMIEQEESLDVAGAVDDILQGVDPVPDVSTDKETAAGAVPASLQDKIEPEAEEPEDSVVVASDEEEPTVAAVAPQAETALPPEESLSIPEAPVVVNGEDGNTETASIPEPLVVPVEEAQEQESAHVIPEELAVDSEEQVVDVVKEENAAIMPEPVSATATIDEKEAASALKEEIVPVTSDAIVVATPQLGKVTVREPFWVGTTYKEISDSLVLAVTPLESMEELLERDGTDLFFKTGAHLTRAAIATGKAAVFASQAMGQALTDQEVASFATETVDRTENVSALRNLEAAGSTCGAMLQCLRSSSSTQQALEAAADTTQSLISAATSAAAWAVKSVVSAQPFFRRVQKKVEESKKYIKEQEERIRKEQLLKEKYNKIQAIVENKCLDASIAMEEQMDQETRAALCKMEATREVAKQEALANLRKEADDEKRKVSESFMAASQKLADNLED